MSIGHYENFPVGSILLPRKLRRPIHAIYHFARTADDIADEDNLAPHERLTQLEALETDLQRLATGQPPQHPLIQQLEINAIRPFSLPLQPFFDLISAFKQDVTQTRYQNFGELINYCRRSANPIGRIMLHLFGETDSRSIAQSDGICTALQLINFWQDIAIDYQKGRIYLPQDDMEKFGVTEAHLATHKTDFAFQRLLAHECEKAHKMLKAGSPLAHTLKGRYRFELKMIILGGQRIIQKLDEEKYDIFNHRPTLNIKDWLLIIKRAWQAK